MLCSYAKGVQGPTGTRRTFIGSQYVRVFFGDFDHAATASDIAAAAAAAAAKARLLLLLMLSVIGEEAARHTHCSMVSTFTYI